MQQSATGPIKTFRDCLAGALITAGSFGICLAGGDRGTPSVLIASADGGQGLEIDVKGVGREPLLITVSITDIDGTTFQLPVQPNPVPPPNGGRGRLHGPVIPEEYKDFMISVEVQGSTTGSDDGWDAGVVG